MRRSPGHEGSPAAPRSTGASATLALSVWELGRQRANPSPGGLDLRSSVEGLLKRVQEGSRYDRPNVHSGLGQRGPDLERYDQLARLAVFERCSHHGRHTLRELAPEKGPAVGGEVSGKGHVAGAGYPQVPPLEDQPGEAHPLTV